VRTCLEHNFLSSVNEAFRTPGLNATKHGVLRAGVLPHVEHSVGMSTLLPSMERDHFDCTRSKYFLNTVQFILLYTTCQLLVPITGGALATLAGFLGFLQPPEVNARMLPMLHYRLSLSNPFQFIIHQSSYHRPYTV
jgi:hypothetical protein